LDPLYGRMPQYNIPSGAIGSAKGRGTLPANLSMTGVIGQMALLALERLGKRSKGADAPFVLTVSFGSPHPPLVSSTEYINYYWNNQSKLLVPPSIDDPLSNSAYKSLQKRGKNNYNKGPWIQEMMAVYYSVVQEVDDWIGTLTAKLNDLGKTGYCG
jgi:arylsulfatase A-like enzyme